VDLFDLLTSEIALCQPVGTLPAKPACFMEAVKQRETVIELDHQEPISGKLLQATDSEHNWHTLVVGSGASRISTPHKSDSAELHPSSGSVADGIVVGCSIRGEGVCELAVAAEESTEITLRAQACFVLSLGSGSHLQLPQGIKTTDGNCGIGHQSCNFNCLSVTGKIPIKPNTSGWDGFGVMPTHVIETPCHPQANLPTNKVCTSKNGSKLIATLIAANPDKELEFKNRDLFAGQ